MLLPGTSEGATNAETFTDVSNGGILDPQLFAWPPTSHLVVKGQGPIHKDKARPGFITQAATSL